MWLNSLSFLIIGFILSSALITFSGTKLSKYGEIIAELTGMSKAWLGMILMAAITSLPEFFTGISAIILIDSPDIAVGGIMGSLTFNLLILALLDYFVPQKPLASVVTKNHALAGFFSMILIIISIIGILYGKLIPNLGWFSTFPVLLIILYLFSMRILHINELRLLDNNFSEKNTRFEEKYGEVTLRSALINYFFNAILVVLGALIMPYFAENLAILTGLSKSFIGTLLVAATTSLPELVVSIAAVRIGSMDMAVGNLLGSNIFNMLILALDDLFYTKGDLLLVSDSNHILSALIALLMTAVVGISVLFGSSNKRFALGIDALLIIIMYLFLILSLYKLD